MLGRGAVLPILCYFAVFPKVRPAWECRPQYVWYGMDEINVRTARVGYTFPKSLAGVLAGFCAVVIKRCGGQA